MEMSRLTWDGTAEPVSRGQILRHERGQGNIILVQLTTCRIDNLIRLIHTLAICVTIHYHAAYEFVSYTPYTYTTHLLQRYARVTYLIHTCYTRVTHVTLTTGGQDKSKSQGSIKPVLCAVVYIKANSNVLMLHFTSVVYPNVAIPRVTAPPACWIVNIKFTKCTDIHYPA